MARLLGGPETKLVVLRGPSGSGKSSAAKRARVIAGRGVALVEQDYLRRIVLREKEDSGRVNISLIDQVVRHCLNNGYHVLLEGILWSGRYREVLQQLHDDHAGSTQAFYLDVDFEDTVRRHAQRPQATEFSVDDMRAWFCAGDLLEWPCETVIGQQTSLEGTVAALVAALTC